MFYRTLAPDALAAVAARFPAQASATLAAADRVMRHEFDLLGSGPYVPRDDSRASAANGYEPIDWLFDPVARGRFPSGVPSEQWNFATMKPVGGDVKRVWELARAQHLPLLAQAYRLSGDARYAVEIVDEIHDFLDANPVGSGVLWTVAMDVAIRALNWALALELVRGCPDIDDAAWQTAYAALFAHGAWVETHLENTYEVTSNHFLSDVVGLFYLGELFGDLPSGARWQRDARAWLEQEARVQILPDGADYESSLPYHRLVLELLLGPAHLAARRGRPMSSAYVATIERMTSFLLASLTPDGRMPQIGDNDDGRLHVLSGYGSRPHTDPRHLIGPAAVMCNRREWLAFATDADRWELAWWGCPDDAGEAPPLASLPPVAAHFPDAGVTVARAPGLYLVVANGVVGTRGFGNHKHNDQLSFEYHCARPLIVDPGTYVYTSDPAARNLFRSTAYHNTVMVDGIEQHETRPDYLFRLFEHGRPETVSWSDSAERFEYTGRHHGYSRLADAVVHERCVRLEKRAATLTIVDRLRGAGRHRLAWHFHLAPGVSARAGGSNRIDLASGPLRWTLAIPAGATAVVSDAWYSPSYGVREACRAVDVSIESIAADGRDWAFTLRRSA